MCAQVEMKIPRQREWVQFDKKWERVRGPVGQLKRCRRPNVYHDPKQQHIVGSRAAHIAPAWKPNAPGQPGQPSPLKGKAPADSGSKIFLSRLPFDVGEKEVEELFNKTVGPVRESFLVYNSQGKSKGMAVVTFQRPGDAVIARTKYNGRVVDGRRGIKIEIMVDSDAPVARPQATPSAPSLFDRLAPKPLNRPATTSTTQNNISTPSARQLAHLNTTPMAANPRPIPAIKEAPIPNRRFKQKKGPKRLKKQLQPVTVADLDKEMEDYRASAPEYLGL